MRIYILSIILLLAAVATAVNLLAKPIDPPLAADARSPGAWRFEAASAAPLAAPQMLFAPCPLTPQNLPIVPPERRV